ncbi:MAG TPA: type IV toxin-antitoxin system AbiEi family antitoxin [Kofleriaceae bacterium]|nr:type IV toxin-antitoxin system AbiEi family antitoxin [Kofleriaceae bacterium]
MSELEPTYLNALEQVPGVRSYKVLRPVGGRGDQEIDALVRLRTEAGTSDLLVQQFRSHLSHKAVDHVIANAGRAAEPVLVLAPHIGAGLAAKLVAAGLNYLDADGNCHIAAAPLYIHIEGKTAATRRSADKGIRSAGYQVLFAYLADPTLLDATVRSVAERAGVSRQPVSDMRRRLVEDQYVFETKTATRWHRRRLQDALGLWLGGYETVLRPSLLWGTYRTDTDPSELEERIAQAFPKAGLTEFRWGGSAAGFRLTGHYRGERTVVHVPEVPATLPKRLRALSDPRGNLVLMNAFGSLNWAPDRDTVHPLLVYAEMLNEAGERAREAAKELYDEHLAPIWQAAA